jgi:hypothetical protein
MRFLIEYGERLQSLLAALSDQKSLLDTALTMPEAILTFRLAGENFARSRDKTNC